MPAENYWEAGPEQPASSDSSLPGSAGGESTELVSLRGELRGEFDLLNVLELLRGSTRL